MRSWMVGVAFLVTPSAMAQTLALEVALGAPNALAYRGDFELDAGRAILRGSLIRGDGHQRIDAWTPAGLVTVVSAYEAATATIIVPARQAYLTVPLDTPGLADYFPDPRDHSEVVISGVEETDDVDGVEAERRTITGVTADGVAYSAEIWTSAEGAVLLVEGATATGEEFEFELEDYQLAEPAKTEFDIPSGYAPAASLAALGIGF